MSLRVILQYSAGYVALNTVYGTYISAWQFSGSNPNDKMTVTAVAFFKVVVVCLGSFKIYDHDVKGLLWSPFVSYYIIF